jgi:hypothetical protein
VKKFVAHVALPSLAPLALVALILTPKATFGCANRGWMALAVVLVSAMAAAAAAVKAREARRRHPADHPWWTLSMLVLMLPATLLFGLLRASQG